LYQPDEEKARALENEPIGRFSKLLIEQGIAPADALEGIDREVDEEIEAAIEAALAAPEPAPEDTLEDLFVEQA
jgi:TPP-dependent pyruvate/acetoin dehydrogenase alpha subunit